ncbi:glycosyltransferase family 4 protein [Pacificimonas sp. ICDLI1SI03]
MSAGRNERRVGGPRNLWIYATFFPPSTAAGAFRPYSFAKFAPRNGWRTTVLTIDPDTTGIGQSPLPPAEDCQLIQKQPIHSRRLWRLEHAIDGGFSQVRAFLAAGADKRVERPDAILATGPSFASFPAAVASAFRHRVPLILDYRDEWTECPFDFVTAGRYGRQIEKFCLSRADRVLFTTRSMRDHALTVFGNQLAQKSLVLPNGVDISPAESTAPGPGDESTIRVAFIGNLAAHTSPDGFLEKLAATASAQDEQMDRLSVSFIGPKDPAIAKKLADFPVPSLVNDVAPVPKSEVPALLSAAHVLILFADKRLERYIPSKLFDYLAARRPIAIWGSDGEAGRIVRTLKVGDVVNSIEELLRLADRGFHPDEEKLAAFLKEHRRDNIADQLFGILDSLTPESGT